MPLISKDARSYKVEGTEKQAKEKPQKFDPFAPGLVLEAGQRSKLDPEDNPFTRLAPPPKGRYQLKCFSQKDGYTKGTSRDGSLYYSASIECRIINHSNAEYNDAIVFPRAFYSSVGRGRKISTMAKMIQLWGYGKSLEQKGYELTEAEQVKLFAMALKKEPTIWADLDWEGQFNAGTKENPDYQMPFHSMDDFPTDDEGNPIHSVTVSNGQGGTVEVNARLRVVEWIGKNNTAEQGAIKVVEAPVEVAEEKPKPVKAETKPNGKPKLVKAEPKEEVIEEVAEALPSDDELVLED